MMRRLAVAAGLAAALVSGMIGGQAAAGNPLGGGARPGDGCWDPEPCPIRLKDVDMLSANEGWAVGDGGTILSWNGLRWRPQPSPTVQPLGSVSMVSASDGWAAGGEGTLLRWDGSAWAPKPSPTNDWISDIAMRSATDGWLATATGIWRWDGAQWTKRSEVGAAEISVLNASDA